jgi:hypothetical protein
VTQTHTPDAHAATDARASHACSSFSRSALSATSARALPCIACAHVAVCRCRAKLVDEEGNELQSDTDEG